MNEGIYDPHDLCLFISQSVPKTRNKIKLKFEKVITLYADLAGFVSTTVITGVNLRSDLLLTFKKTCLYIFELTVGFETNLSSNAAQKTYKYQDLIVNLRQQYNDVKLTSLPISTLGIISSLSTSFIDMLKEIKVENIHQEYILKIYHSTKKRQHNFDILKAFFVRHSSEYENVG